MERLDSIISRLMPTKSGAGEMLMRTQQGVGKRFAKTGIPEIKQSKNKSAGEIEKEKGAGRT